MSLNLVVNSCSERKAYAKNLATELGLPFLANTSTFDGEIICGEKLELRIKDIGSITVDFLNSQVLKRKQREGKKQAIARAIGIKSNHKPSIIDATAGLGKDSFVFAALGCKVTLIEKSAIIGALLADGLERARANTKLVSTIKNMQLNLGDANQLIAKLPNHEVIYLDPMYPIVKTSSLPKKELQILRALTVKGPINNLAKNLAESPEYELLQVARLYAQKRVVVKRPKNATFLADIKPDIKITMKNTRFDIYLSKNPVNFYL